MPCFVLEIGTEEIPARFLDKSEKDLKNLFSSSLKEYNLNYSKMESFSTPRRLSIIIEGLLDKSLEKEEVVTGPPVKAAYDVGGRPTRAAEGFAKTHGVSLDDTFTLKNDKGEYLAIKKKTGGEPAGKILSNICPEIISKLSFPKSMKWGSGSFTFARPLRWILALLDEEVINFEIGNLKSSKLSFGHRVHGAGPFAIDSAQDYLKSLDEKEKVIASSQERRDIIINQGNKLAEGKKGRVLWNESLLDEVKGLVEHPVPLLGCFDASFLELPREVLLTSMQAHQKSFGLQSESGDELLPFFLTVLNLTPSDPSLVKKGWERVLRARLEDARFFWNTDLDTSFDKWLDSLESVIFLAPLGSMGDKSRRIAELSGWLANNVSFVNAKSKVQADDLIRAGRLSKADLVSEMVKEFDTLQGVMGGIYAKEKGESDIVAQAIREQYLPAGPDTPVPASLAGALVSMADKADTLVGCFGLSMIPTGTADPYGLRRACLGIARIIIEKGIRINLNSFFKKAKEVYGDREWKMDSDQILIRLKEFFTLRLKNHFISSGAETLYAEAILQADASDPWAADARLKALIEFSQTEKFEPSTSTFKRVANIINKQSEEITLTGDYDDSLFQEPQENILAKVIEELAPEFGELWLSDSFSTLFERLAELQPVVDEFFDNVMVMSEDEKIRENRLNLLKALLNHFVRLADFAALQK